MIKFTFFYLIFAATLNADATVESKSIKGSFESSFYNKFVSSTRPFSHVHEKKKQKVVDNHVHRSSKKYHDTDFEMAQFYQAPDSKLKMENPSDGLNIEKNIVIGSNNNCKNNEEPNVKVKVVTDDWPNQSSWSI